MFAPRSSLAPIIAVALLLAIEAILIPLWLGQDTYPFPDDESLHLAHALERARACQGPASLPGCLLHQDPLDYYPPLGRVPAVVACLGVGVSRNVAVMANLLFWALALASTAALGWRRAGPWGAVLAPALLAAIPLFQALAHCMTLDLPLAAMVALSMMLLERSEAFSRPKASYLFGVAVGLGLLVKWTYAFFLIFPLALALFRALDPPEGRRARAITITLSLGLAGAVASPWYLPRLLPGPVLQRLLFQAAYRPPSMPPEAALREITFYPYALMTYGVLLPLFLVAIWAAGRLWRQRARGAEELAAWCLGSMVLLAMVPDKAARYLLPLLPALAVMMAQALASLSRPYRAPLMALTLALASAQTGLLLYAQAPQLHRALLWPGPWAVLTGKHLATAPWISPPAQEHLILDDILDALPTGETVAMWADAYLVSPAPLRARAAARGKAITIISPAEDLEAFVHQAPQAWALVAGDIDGVLEQGRNGEVVSFLERQSQASWGRRAQERLEALEGLAEGLRGGFEVRETFHVRLDPRWAWRLGQRWPDGGIMEISLLRRP